MRSLLLILFLVPLTLLPLLGGPASAGIFSKKPKKPTPNERVPELINILKTDGDENKRAGAAQELRQYDPTAYPQIVPALVEVLQGDKKPGVRAEAAQSLGKLRPISQQAGMALEQALGSDPSMRVRLQARSSLLQYHWSGYQSARKDELLSSQTKEPPLADGKVPPALESKPPTLPPPGRIAPQPTALPATGSRVPPGAPAPFPLAPPRRPTTREPPLAPPSPDVPPVPAPPPSGDVGPELTPP